MRLGKYSDNFTDVELDEWFEKVKEKVKPKNLSGIQLDNLTNSIHWGKDLFPWSWQQEDNTTDGRLFSVIVPQWSQQIKHM